VRAEAGGTPCITAAMGWAKSTDLCASSCKFDTAAARRPVRRRLCGSPLVQEAHEICSEPFPVRHHGRELLGKVAHVAGEHDLPLSVQRSGHFDPAIDNGLPGGQQLGRAGSLIVIALLSSRATSRG